MDPFLEAPTVWPVFQHQLVAAVYHLLLPGIADRYRARISTRQFTTELALFTSIVREQHTEEYVEIRSRNDGRLVTLIDCCSPTNKTTPGGKAAYLATRTEALSHKAGTVELDLVTQGTPPLDFDRTGLPPCQYTVTVTRPISPERFEVYAGVLRNRLPKFKLPLAADDRDTVLDLQAAMSKAYDATMTTSTIDYRNGLPVDVKLTDDDRTWVRDWLTRMSPA
jgi:hypothetical protein